MEEKRKDAGTPPPAADTPMTSADVPSAEAPTSRRRGGGHKRKASAIGSGASSTPPSTLSKRQKQSAVPFPPIHNGPLTRARQQPNNAAAAAASAVSPSGFGVRIESEVLPKAEVGVEEAVKVDKESNQVKEDLEALEAEIEAEIESIRSRDRNVHVVPTHAGEFQLSSFNPQFGMLSCCAEY
ncbi:hypothetical protein KY290_003248 [Solanum tuberosum]|uniref:Uncharacterized protein n=1 Tax=Solanum tuberosum TaxID=4113 RepID=A0ABQ7WSX6_SOLTU|nr:hypothetical protein KY290_003248 [Solanum tuberosum]